jgi:urea carboxylase-associated protein 2
MPDGLHITAPPPTGTLAGAREHARSLAGTAAGNGPTVPAASATDLPDEASDARIVWAETIGQGGYASRRLPRGAVLRILDPVGDACVQLLVHNARQPAERLNVADTVKIQWQAYLGHGALLLSDMGRAMMTIVADTSERHDCLCGATVRRANEQRYGDAAAGGAHPSARDLLALGLGKFGLSRRDVAPNINLFKSVRVDDTGALHFDGAARPGTHVDLRAEMDVIVTLANSPHPLDDRPEYHASGVRCIAWLPRSGPPLLDPFRTSTPERTRAFENTDEYLSGVPG